ncbi:transcriptional regulator domain-containing protein [Variovorax sp. ZT4R33]|uniref:transcriptional regulator domain-containing protein n=1 Tax=Variovorax sp. ZT4R33 TaxID=3443743 RepID=UPI003F45D762
MTALNVDDLPREPWGVSAAYLYILDLDGPALGWEYLRRHPQYRAAWALQRPTAWFERWGLRQRRTTTSGCARGAAALGHLRWRTAARARFAGAGRGSGSLGKRRVRPLAHARSQATCARCCRSDLGG